MGTQSKQTLLPKPVKSTISKDERVLWFGQPNSDILFVPIDWLLFVVVAILSSWSIWSLLYQSIFDCAFPAFIALCVAFAIPIGEGETDQYLETRSVFRH